MTSETKTSKNLSVEKFNFITIVFKSPMISTNIMGKSITNL